ncbi:26S protease regulatory subunit 6B-like protein [Hordeum vulgare]|nr:26S protease regulatory subunit 6B-like protein [Hordeum vulgare]
MKIVVCVDDMCKTERMLGSWFVDDRYGFLLRRLSRGGVPDLEFDGVSGVLPRSDSFSDKGFTFGESPWRSAKLHIGDGAASSSDEKSLCDLYFDLYDMNETHITKQKKSDGLWLRNSQILALFEDVRKPILSLIVWQNIALALVLVSFGTLLP